jgi:hypothetical protein
MHRITRNALGLLAGATLLATFFVGTAAAADTQVVPDLAAPVASTLINGWTNAPFGTSAATVQTVSNIVHFKGAIATTGTNAEPFVLPAAFRPATAVDVPVDLCNATNGRLFIKSTGVVTVEAETSFSNAQCFTSLDGTSFVR